MIWVTDVIENKVANIIKSVAEKANTPVIDIFSAAIDHPEYLGDGLQPNTEGNN